MVEQAVLWHDSLEDALGSVIHALGGRKAVAEMLWPVLYKQKPDTAYSRISHCLNPEKAEKFSPDELITILEKANEIGAHEAMQYIGMRTRYEVNAVSPGDAKKRARIAKRKWHLAELARLEDE